MIVDGRAVWTVLSMELTAETKLNASQHYSPTSTPVLDVFRALPPQTKDSLSAGEYFLASSLAILTLVALPSLRAIIEIAPGYWAALIPLVAVLIAGVAHEAGHLLAAWLFGFRLRQIRVGPLHLGKHARYGEPYSGDVITLGAAVLEPRNADHDDPALRLRLSFLLLGGPLVDDNGGLLIYEVADRDELRAVVDSEPYVKAGFVAESRILEWQPRMGSWTTVLT